MARRVRPNAISLPVPAPTPESHRAEMPWVQRARLAVAASRSSRSVDLPKI